MSSLNLRGPLWRYKKNCITQLLSSQIQVTPPLAVSHMGFTLPSPMSTMEQARALIARKENIEAEIEAQISVLKANFSTLQSPLVDQDGFPRADIDIYAVRGARVRIIELRNDLDAVMNAIAGALEGIYDPSLDTSVETNPPADSRPKPFAKVNGVAPGSPAAEAVRIHVEGLAICS